MDENNMADAGYHLLILSPNMGRRVTSNCSPQTAVCPLVVRWPNLDLKVSYLTYCFFNVLAVEAVLTPKTP